MKRLVYIVCALLFVGTLAAQDQQILSQTELLGTARYVGMAGAMTAVGGDPSAVKDNPAGLGVYRRLEVMLTLEEKLDKVHQYGASTNVIGRNAFMATQASFVFSMVDNDRSRGLIANNFMLSYHRLKNYQREYSAGYRDDIFSLSDVIAQKTNGLTASDLQPEDRWENTEIAWLSCQGYDTYLIDPDPKDPVLWTSKLRAGDLVNTHMHITETGNINQFSFGWGGNISNRYFVGVSLNMLSLYHNQTVQYTEYFRDSCGLYNDTYVSYSGVGVNAEVGFIAHPVRWLRLGVSLTTPSYTSITLTSYGDLMGIVPVKDSLGVYRTTNITSPTPQSRVTDKSIRLPLRVSAGAAFQLKNYGLLSLQYDMAYDKNIYMTHAFRAGLEGVIVNRFFLNAGYAFEGTFKQPKAQCLPYNTIRTDAYSQFSNHSHYITAGFGYRSTHFSIHGAYRLRMQQFDTFAHELATPYDLRAMTHSIVISIGFHTR